MAEGADFPSTWRESCSHWVQVRSHSDLATTKSDAAQSNGNCSASDDAEGDAEDVEGDAEDVAGDLEDLQSDISTAQSDITTLKGDLAKLSNYSLPSLSGAPTAISSLVLANIASATATANGYICTVNADVSQAYSIANGISTGSCSSDAQSTPSPMPAM